MLFSPPALSSTSGVRSSIPPEIPASSPLNERNNRRKQRKLNGTVPRDSATQDMDLDADSVRLGSENSDDAGSWKDIVLENERERFLLTILPTSVVDDKRVLANKENIPMALENSLTVVGVEKAGKSKRKYRVCLLETQEGKNMSSSSVSAVQLRVLRSNFGEDDVDFNEEGITFTGSQLGLTESEPNGQELDVDGDVDVDGRKGWFMRVRRWRWPSATELGSISSN